MIDQPDVTAVFYKAINEHSRVLRAMEDQIDALQRIAELMVSALRSGAKILWCGNGGSAADSQHLAAELVGRFRRERQGFASVALTTDTSILTAIANDFGYEAVFSRQVEALGRSGDVLVGISTSGNSASVISALKAARAVGLKTVALTGSGGGKIAALADLLIAVPSEDTARIQEMHILAGHMLCDWVEVALSSSESRTSQTVAPKGVLEAI